MSFSWFSGSFFIPGDLFSIYNGCWDITYTMTWQLFLTLFEIRYSIWPLQFSYQNVDTFQKFSKPSNLFIFIYSLNPIWKLDRECKILNWKSNVCFLKRSVILNHNPWNSKPLLTLLSFKLLNLDHLRQTTNSGWNCSSVLIEWNNGLSEYMYGEMLMR